MRKNSQRFLVVKMVLISIGIGIIFYFFASLIPNISFLEYPRIKKLFYLDLNSIWFRIAGAGFISIIVFSAQIVAVRLEGSKKILQERERYFGDISRLVSDDIFSFLVGTDRGYTPDTSLPQSYRITGLNLAEMMEITSADDWQKIFFREDLPRFRQWSKRLLDGEKVEAIEARIKSKEGGERWVNIFARSNWDPAERRVTRVMGAVQDITNRKQTELVLQETMEKLRIMFETVGEAVMITDLNGLVTEANPAALRLHGIADKRELVGKKAIDLFSPEDRSRIRDDMQLIFSQGQIGTGEYKILTKDGRILDSEINASLLKNKDGKPIGFVAISRDISERKRIQEELASSEERYKSLVEGSETGIARIDLDGNFVFVNKALCKLTGYREEEIVGRGFTEFLHPTNREQISQLFSSSIASPPESYLDEYLALHKSGREIFLSTKPTFVYEDDRLTGVITIIEDVTERRQAQDLILAQRDLGIALSATSNLNEALRACLESAIQASGMDSGGVYLVEEQTGALELAVSHGLSPDFIRAVSHYDASASNNVLIMKGEPVFARHRDLGLSYQEVHRREGLRALAVIPILFENKVIACFNMASHVSDDIPMMARHALASISTQIGNVIARIKAEALLWESEEKYRSLFENSIEGIGISKGNRILFLNQAAQNILGYESLEDIIKIPLSEHIAPESREVFQERRIKLERGGPVFDRYEYKVIRKSGEFRDIESSMNPILIGGEECVLETFRDVTERKRVEKELVNIQKAVEGSGDAIGISDAQGRHFYQNKAFSDIFEYSVDELRNPLGAVVVFSEPETGRRVFETIMRGDSWRGEIEMTAKSGRIIPVIGRADAIKDNEGKVISLIGIFTDLTEQKRAEGKQKEFEYRLEEERIRAINFDRLRSLGEMAAGIAHELNQPLLGVRGLAEHVLIGLDREWKFPKNKIREKLNLIMEQADRMSNVIEHVRMFARGADGSELIPIEVGELIKSSTNFFRAQLRPRGLQLKCDLKNDLPRVMANPFSLEEVLFNLLSNACDALDEKKAAVPAAVLEPIIVRMRLENKDNQNFVAIEVIDRGMGMPEDIKEKVFDPFFTTKGPDKGTGLGLAISKPIIESFYGRIEIDSKHGEGTTVSILIPAIPDNSLKRKSHRGASPMQSELKADKN